MKAVGLYRYLPIDHPEALLDFEIEAPVTAGRDLLVEVKAISVNPVDTKRRAPKDQVETTPRVLGWDVAGVVKAAGPQVTLFKPGDEVWYAGSVVRQGGNSELHLVDERIVGRKPRRLGFAEAAALPLTAITAWEAMFERMAISKSGAHAGKTILMIGAAGGVGSIAIQLAKKLAKLKVIATASRPETAAWVRELGADVVIDHSKPLAEQLKKEGLAGVNYVFCLSSTDQYSPQFAALLNAFGRVCCIVGAQKPVDMAPLMQKSASFSWELMFTRSSFQTPDMIGQHELLEELAALVDAGVVRTTVKQNLGKINAANVRRAHQLLEQGRVIGKLVLEGF